MSKKLCNEMPAMSLISIRHSLGTAICFIMGFGIILSNGHMNNEKIVTLHFNN